LILIKFAILNKQEPCSMKCLEILPVFLVCIVIVASAKVSVLEYTCQAIKK
jgi:hypothetical protein